MACPDNVPKLGCCEEVIVDDYAQCVYFEIGGRVFGDGVIDAEQEAVDRMGQTMDFLRGCLAPVIPESGPGQARTGTINPDCTITYVTAIPGALRAGAVWGWNIERVFNSGSLEFDFGYNVSALKCRQAIGRNTPICIQREGVLPTTYPSRPPCEATIENAVPGFRVLDMPPFPGGFIKFGTWHPPDLRGGGYGDGIWFPDSPNVGFTCCNFFP